MSSPRARLRSTPITARSPDDPPAHPPPGAARGARRDRGSSAIELVILAPLLLAIIWMTIQYALYYQGRQVALAAAQLGARVASQDADTVPGWQALAERD